MVLAHRRSTRMEQHRDLTVSPQLLEVNLLCLWNAGGLVKKKTELEHVLKKESIDICCIQETPLKKDKSFKLRGYQCIRTDRGGEKKDRGVLTLVKSHINAYLIAQQKLQNTKPSK